MKRLPLALVTAALLAPAAPALAQQHQHGAHDSHARHGATASEPATIAAVSEALTRAIIAGDTSAVERLLLPEATIHEGGEVESRAQYFGHHFGADGAFLRAMRREPLTRTVEVDGHTARVTTTSRLHGTYRGRTLDLVSTEVLELRHSADGGWRVAEVHWSSEPRG